MNRRRAMVLKSFLSRCPLERSVALERFLPEQERLILSGLPTFDKVEGHTRGPLLEEVHWSWFLPTLKSYPEQERSLFLHALGGAAQTNLRNELNLPAAVAEISESGRSFLREILLHSLVGSTEWVIPKEYLPPSPLNVLLKLGKKELIHLIDLLSLHDLAHEMRQIVETKILKKIYSFLTEEEKRFLKPTTAHQEPYSVSRIGLERWDGTEENFRHLLHRRGLARFGAALSGQDPDLIWYLCHQLDIGRGSALHKCSLPEPIPGISEWVIRQIEELLANPDIKL